MRTEYLEIVPVDLALLHAQARHTRALFLVLRLAVLEPDAAVTPLRAQLALDRVLVQLLDPRVVFVAVLPASQRQPRASRSRTQATDSKAGKGGLTGTSPAPSPA